MANYAATSDLTLLFQAIWEVVDEDTYGDLYIDKAHAWLVDSCRPYFDPPATSPSELLTLAEANYAVFMILRGSGDTTLNTRSLGFQQEAWRLIRHIVQRADTEDTNSGGPASSAANVEHEFTTGKHDTDGRYLGNKMGIADDNKGSLDEF